jgi:hypothetical protein
LRPADAAWQRRLDLLVGQGGLQGRVASRDFLLVAGER